MDRGRNAEQRIHAKGNCCELVVPLLALRYDAKCNHRRTSTKAQASAPTLPVQARAGVHSGVEDPPFDR